MKRTLTIIGAVLLIAVIAVAAYVLRTPEEASAPIEALPIAESRGDDAAAIDEVQVESPADDDAMEAKPEDLPAADDEAPEDPVEPEEALSEDSGEVETEAGAGNIYTISQDGSEVSFSINELLRGNPTTAVGISNQVAGEIQLDLNAPAEAQVGVILVNARTLQTDQSFRNRAIQNEILDTAEYEFITFTPKQIVGLPDAVAVGDTVSLQLIGDLTIRNFTNEETFELTVTLVSETQLEGYASATVLRSNYDLQIPEVTSVAGVEDEVLLEITFVAVK